MNNTKEKGSKLLSILVTLMMLLATFSMLLITTTPVVFANITEPTVSVSPTAARVVDADYTITFNVGPGGALTHGLSTIAILFPVDTAVASGFIPGTVNDVVIVSSGGNPVSRIVQISTPVDVDDDGEVVVMSQDDLEEYSMAVVFADFDDFSFCSENGKNYIEGMRVVIDDSFKYPIVYCKGRIPEKYRKQIRRSSHGKA
jgi:hypothetical protein